MERLRLLAEKAGQARDRGGLLGIEGEAAPLYFQALPSLFTDAARLARSTTAEGPGGPPPIY